MNKNFLMVCHKAGEGGKGPATRKNITFFTAVVKNVPRLEQKLGENNFCQKPFPVILRLKKRVQAATKLEGGGGRP